jgi:hypothetical protein
MGFYYLECETCARLWREDAMAVAAARADGLRCPPKPFKRG